MWAKKILKLGIWSSRKEAALPGFVVNIAFSFLQLSFPKFQFKDTSWIMPQKLCLPGNQTSLIRKIIWVIIRLNFLNQPDAWNQRWNASKPTTLITLKKALQVQAHPSVFPLCSNVNSEHWKLSIYFRAALHAANLILPLLLSHYNQWQTIAKTF